MWHLACDLIVSDNRVTLWCEPPVSVWCSFHSPAWLPAYFSINNANLSSPSDFILGPASRTNLPVSHEQPRWEVLLNAAERWTRYCVVLDFKCHAGSLKARMYYAHFNDSFLANATVMLLLLLSQIATKSVPVITSALHHFDKPHKRNYSGAIFLLHQQSHQNNQVFQTICRRHNLGSNLVLFFPPSKVISS